MANGRINWNWGGNAVTDTNAVQWIVRFLHHKAVTEEEAIRAFERLYDKAAIQATGGFND